MLLTLRRRSSLGWRLQWLRMLSAHEGSGRALADERFPAVVADQPIGIHQWVRALAVSERVGETRNV
jgi:hypothetical protein